MGINERSLRGSCLSPKASTDFPEEVGNRIRLLVPFGHQRQNLNRHAIYHRGIPPETPGETADSPLLLSIFAIIFHGETAPIGAGNRVKSDGTKVQKVTERTPQK